MKPAPFRYRRAESLDEAVGLLADSDGDGRILAGGQTLIAAMNDRRAAPSFLIDIMRATDLKGLTTDDTHLELRAGVRQAEAEDSEVVARAAPLLHEAIRYVAYREVRNAGTVCGSAAYGDPLGEIPTVVATLGGEMIAAGPHGRRSIPADRFFAGHCRTALEPDEVLAAVRLPIPGPASGFCFREAAPRNGGYATVGAAAKVQLKRGVIVDAAVGLLGAADTPVRSTAADRLLVGAEPTEALFAEAAAAVAAACEPIDDVHATAAYRRQLVDVLTRRALAGAVTRSREA